MKKEKDNMKTFEDLEFNPHANRRKGSVQARMDLGDELAISVVAGEGDRMGSADKIGHGLYNDDGTYEIAVFDRGSMAALSEWDDVLGWQTPEDINTLLEEIQSDRDAFRKKCAGRRDEKECF